MGIDIGEGELGDVALLARFWVGPGLVLKGHDAELRVRNDLIHAEEIGRLAVIDPVDLESHLFERSFYGIAVIGFKQKARRR